MGLNATVIVATCGGSEWERLAIERAIPSASDQAEVIHVHGDTVAGARNAAMERVETEFFITLDADDELEPGYVEAMARGTADVRAPRVRCYRRGRPVNGGLFMPRIGGHEHDCAAECLEQGNWIVVGAAVRTQLALEVGGFDGRYPVYEDFALWLNLYLAGATFEPVPDAIYRQHLRPRSRNHVLSAAEKNHWHMEIERDAVERWASTGELAVA